MEDHAVPVVLRSFFFSAQEITFLRNQLEPHLGKCSRFELLAACMWRCRTSSLGLDPDDEVRLAFVVNARTRYNPPLPLGFYGNAFGVSAAVSTAGKLCQSPLGYAVQLIRNCNDEVTDEFMRSSADLMVQKGRPHFVTERTYLVSNMTPLGFNGIDFGWGKPVYGGPADCIPQILSLFLPLTNNEGEQGISVAISLPGPSMDVFVKEIEKMKMVKSTVGNSSFIGSPM